MCCILILLSKMNRKAPPHCCERLIEKSKKRTHNSHTYIIYNIQDGRRTITSRPSCVRTLSETHPVGKTVDNARAFLFLQVYFILLRIYTLPFLHFANYIGIVRGIVRSKSAKFLPLSAVCALFAQFIYF